uniref:NADP-dependent oxidoreductase domain-containing protein n=1 Tax=Kwoniella dejecticola CBS 10117 TaxID=1296121 RepID=A0A1A6AEM6_9TREE|nr:uncharacterized protein I303_00337 [Kwoniella dejecticola CBS 10117]OBR88520.1 hypothetical protein I303_00337 [Kwoniella dejecticola CBS 10117]
MKTLSGLTLTEAWAQMEHLRAEGKCKDIGVSNCASLDIRELSKNWNVVPAVNQIELSPHNAHAPRSIACRRIFLGELSEKLDLTEGQILFKWAQQTMDGPVVT